MKGGTFGFSGDCHDLGLACSSGLPFRHIWTPPVLQAETSTDEERVCGHISGFLVEPHLFRALMVVARQLLSIPTA